jgi:aryl-alcohol dehydrogenase-like predicted oxidoreductase
MMTERVDAIIEKVVEIAGDNGKTPAQVSVAWILDHEEVSSAMMGPDLPEHVDEVCGALDWALSADERQALDAVSEPDWLQRYDRPPS